MCLQSSEALVGLDRAGRDPSRGQTGIPPAFDVAPDTGYRTPMAVWRERMQAAKAVDMVDNADALTTNRFKRSRSAGPFQDHALALDVVGRRHRLRRSTLQRTWSALSTARLWRRMGWQASVGQADPFPTPSYAGTNVFGRYQSSKHVGPSGDIRTRLRRMPQDAWRVMIQDHHVGYISWDNLPSTVIASQRTGRMPKEARAPRARVFA